MKLIFERSQAGRKLSLLPESDVPAVSIPESLTRKTKLDLPELSETEISRHYSTLEQQVFGINCGFFPLGSCTMKYNPKVNDEVASLPGFTDLHPLQNEDEMQGSLRLLNQAEDLFCRVLGMDAMTFQPAAGAHGELTALLMMRAYHVSRGEPQRNKILIPDAAHGTNPASAAVAGFEVINLPSDETGCVRMDALLEALGEDTAGLMLTNPNTIGLFDTKIAEITQAVHDAGGLNYYDGANLNPIMGLVRPGDMGFDLVHLNLHKTFSTPHGGGGPGSGPVGCKAPLQPFLPQSQTRKAGEVIELDTPEKSIGRMRTFFGNFLVTVRAFTYLLTLGKEGIPQAAQAATLNANYLQHKLREAGYKTAHEGPCMHEFVLSLSDLKKDCGITALDIAKALQDHGMHPPTMYFPLIVPEALMIEPTETESPEMLDEVARIFTELRKLSYENPEAVRRCPVTTPISRPDEVRAAREPVVVYQEP